jgi:hypothetical protein
MVCLGLNTVIPSFTVINQAAKCYTNNAVGKALLNTPRITQSILRLRFSSYTVILIPAQLLVPIQRLQLAKTNQNALAGKNSHALNQV